jgi:hypothetical protein
MDEQELEWLREIDLDLPVIAKEEIKKKAKKFNYNSHAWKYYLIIKCKFADWWNEFNGDLDNKGKPKYRTIKQFVESRTKDKKHREWLMFMFGTKPHDDHHKREIPYVGDWVKRRRNGYWTEDNKYQIKSLSRAIKDNLEKGETIRATAPFLIQELCRINRLIAKLFDMFGGNPFLNENPTSKGNITRFKTFEMMYNSLFKMKQNTIWELMRVEGVNPEEPNQMWNMGLVTEAIGRAGAAGALTGAVAAGQGMLPGLRPDQMIISKSALLMADHWHKHATVFKKPIPDINNTDPVIEGVVVKEKKEKDKEYKDKSNGHTKAN